MRREFVKLPILRIRALLVQGRALSLRLAGLAGSRVAKDALDQDFDFCAGTFAESPVDGDAFAYPGNKFRRDHFEIVFAHDLESAVVRGQSVVERDFVVVQSEIDAALISFFQLFRELDQFFDDFLGCNGTV